MQILSTQKKCFYENELNLSKIMASFRKPLKWLLALIGLKNIFFGVLLLTLSGCVMDIRDYVGSGRGILGVSGKKTKKI